MAITVSDLVLVGSASRPEDDTSTSGGNEVLTARPLDSQPSATDVIELVSTSASDTMNCTCRGRDDSGAIVQEIEALNGTTPVATAQTFERYLTLTLASPPVGTVTVRQGVGGTVRHTFAPGETVAFIMFINSVSDPSVATDRYEKLHLTNKHATLSLLDAEAEMTADPDDRFQFGLETALNGTGSVANRLTAPAGITFVDNGVAVPVPGDELPAGDEIGIWVEQNLSAGAAAAKSTFTMTFRGTSV